MFDKKYKKVLELLDKQIDFTQQMFDKSLERTVVKEGTTDEEIIKNFTSRIGSWRYVDKYQDQLEALCGLRREIKKEIGRL